MISLARRAANEALMLRDGLRGWRRGRNDFRALASASPQDLERQIKERLTRIVSHALRTVPYYRDAWSGIRLPAAIRPENLSLLPFLTKDILKGQKATLVSSTTRVEDLDVSFTGGTSGTQTSFYRDHECTVARFGRQRGILQRAGYAPGHKRALIWGVSHDLLGPDARGSWKRRFREFANADAVLCCTVMTAQEMRDYHAELVRFAPKVLYGYPKAIEQFARFVDGQRLSKLPVERIFCTAENLHDSQRQLFEGLFGGEVFNLYCCREFGCIGFECSRHRGLHIDAGSVLIEVLVGDRPARPGESGEIVVTDLLNYGMPLIRYRTGDTATAPTEACDCGCAFAMIASLDGRTTETIYRPDGSRVAGLMLTDAVMDYLPVAVIQFVQYELDSLDVNVILAAGNTEPLDSIREQVVRRTREITGHEINLTVHFVPDLLRNPRSGKFEEVICRIGHRAAASVQA